MDIEHSQQPNLSNGKHFSVISVLESCWKLSFFPPQLIPDPPERSFICFGISDSAAVFFFTSIVGFFLVVVLWGLVGLRL